MVFSQVGKTIKQSIFLLYDSLCPADSGREKGDNRAKKQQAPKKGGKRDKKCVRF